MAVQRHCLHTVLSNGASGDIEQWHAVIFNSHSYFFIFEHVLGLFRDDLFVRNILAPFVEADHRALSAHRVAAGMDVIAPKVRIFCRYVDNVTIRSS